MSNKPANLESIQKAELPPPALLRSKEGDYSFSLAILGWESTVMPCTRYDEWILCELTLHTPEADAALNGPYMLRFEVFDLKKAIENCLQTPEFTFQSDFMETAFKINLQSLDSQAAVLISLKPPESKNSSIHHAQFQAGPEQLSVFMKGLELQLEDFYSVL